MPAFYSKPLIFGVVLIAAIMAGPVSARALDEYPHSPPQTGLSTNVEVPKGSKVIERIMRLPGLSNVGIVSPGILRGAQPEPEGYQTLRNMGIRTVINLRTTEHEKEKVEALGMRSIEIPISMIKVVEKEQIDSVLAAMHDPGNQPAYIHCKLGQDRTGIVVASYRVVFDHWTLEEVEEEMQLYGFNDLWQHLRYFLHEYIEDYQQKTRLKDIDKDRQTYLFLRHGLSRTVEYVRTHRDLYSVDEGSEEMPGRNEKMKIWSIWSRILDQYAFLDRLGEKYVLFSGVDNPDEKKSLFS